MSLVRQIFLKKDMEVENNKFGYIKIKKLCSPKDTIKRVKRPKSAWVYFQYVHPTKIHI